MTVATSIDSLLEKLKVEELYLSPSNWESLHSQSRQFPPPTRASPLSSSSVSILKCLERYVAAMIQQPRVPSSGLMPASDVLICAKVVITSRDILVGLLSKHTGNTVANVMRRPYYMDAPKAKEFGVIDRAPEKVVFHLVTNEINYAAMKSWFAMNMDNLRGVTVEVQKFEDFKCLNASYVPVLKQLQDSDTQSYYFSGHNDDGRTSIKFRNPKLKISIYDYFLYVSNVVGLQSKSTATVKSNEQPAGHVSSSSTIATTTNAESSLSTRMIIEELKMYSHLKQFTFLDLNLATRNFRPESLLGEGGFGCVFKGWVEENGTAPVKPGTGLTVAVKTLNLDGLYGHKEWLV
ncbi:hypothetical protein Bca52824_081445 [Brassica carinata]|uniref:Uncharacterized protein n=1 Tax=Brassica carinata TaxID=52824 RepID=A0A8X7TRK9_BRACI|nr:hypothetical protein Bca52824_081445 [Brassica carinata]